MVASTGVARSQLALGNTNTNTERVHCFSCQREKDMATATSFTPKATTVGCVPNPYINGYVYPDGPFALGSTCAAPIIEVRNVLCCPVTVSWGMNLELGQDCVHNQQVIPPKGFALIAGLLPSAGPRLSKIHVEDSKGRIESYVFVHSPEWGYDLMPLAECEGGAQYCQRPSALQLSVSRQPFAPSFAGCGLPSWWQTVIVPMTVKTCG